MGLERRKHICSGLLISLVLTVMMIFAGCDWNQGQESPDLAFDPPPDFERRTLAQRADRVVLMTSRELGSLLVRWNDDQYPDAQEVITMVLEHQGVQARDYRVTGIHALRSEELVDFDADYMEIRLARLEGSESAGFFVRLLFFHSGEHRYLVAYLVDAEKRDEEAVIGAWQRFVSSMRARG